MWLESTTAADQSIAPAALRRSSSTWCRRAHTPARCQSRNRRHAVTPEQPSSRGRWRHAIPVTNTNTIALNATRSGTGRRPEPGGGATGGINGSTTSHTSSRTSNTDAISHLRTSGYVTDTGVRRAARHTFVKQVLRRRSVCAHVQVLRNTRALHHDAHPFAQPPRTRHDATVARPQRLLPLSALAAQRRQRRAESGAAAASGYARSAPRVSSPSTRRQTPSGLAS